MDCEKTVFESHSGSIDECATPLRKLVENENHEHHEVLEFASVTVPRRFSINDIIKCLETSNYGRQEFSGNELHELFCLFLCSNCRIRCIIDVLGLADTTALNVALFGPEEEGDILADSKEHDTVYEQSCYCFLEPQNVFHVYYQERLAEYKMQEMSPLRLPGRASASNPPRARAGAGIGKPYGATPWNGYTPLDEGFRAELEGNLREKWKPSPKK